MSLAVSAIVPTYNRADYLGECLDSVLGQTVPPVQLIVIDDGSTDGTRALVAAYGDRVAYVHQPNAGKSAALNRALGLASGEAVWIVDDDDIAQPKALEQLIAALDAAPDAGFAFGDHDTFEDVDGVRHFGRPAAATFDIDDLHCALLERCFLFQPALLVRKACYDAVGPFDTDFIRAQDYEMLTRLSRHARAVHIPAVLFHQRQHTGIRGSADHSIDGATVWERQKTFDALVLKRVHETNSLTDYLPRGARKDDAAAEVRGLLRRGAVVARKKLWDLAVDDTIAAINLARRRGIAALDHADVLLLGRVFDEFGYARDDLSVRNPLLRCLRELPASPITSTVVDAYSWPIFRYMLLALRTGKLSEAARHARLYAALSGKLTLPRHLSRAAGKTLRAKSA